MSSEAMKLALEALQTAHLAVEDDMLADEIQQAITAIREALAEQPAQQALDKMAENARELGIQMQPAQQEPVAYAVYHRMGGGKSLHWPEQHSPDGDANEYQLVPLYTSSPTLSLAQQEPVGCEGAIVNGRVYADRLEHDYRFECEAGPLHLCNDWVEFRRCFEWLAQHTSPPAQRTWVGLTDEEKRQIFERDDYQGWLDYINAIEAKLKEKNNG